MPELPDITVYIERLRARYAGRVLQRVRLSSPFVLRSVEPPLASVAGKQVQGFRRLGKRIVWELPDELFLVVHLMRSGRLHERRAGAKLGRRADLAGFDFPDATLVFTEASSKHRASLHVVHGAEALATFVRSGVEPLEGSEADFTTALRRQNRTLKRALTDPDIVSGVGNAYSDEILHAARLSPFKLTGRLSDEEMARLFEATRGTLQTWIERLRREVGEGFPEHVTAFHAEMRVHGRYEKPCPECGAPVQRVVYADSECNYCARCQTAERLLADRSLSRLLKSDWPKTLDALEEKRHSHKG